MVCNPSVERPRDRAARALRQRMRCCASVRARAPVPPCGCDGSVARPASFDGPGGARSTEGPCAPRGFGRRPSARPDRPRGAVMSERSSSRTTASDPGTFDSRAMTTTSAPRGNTNLLRRNTSRIQRLIRCRTTLFPTLRETVAPMRAGPSSSRVHRRTTKCSPCRRRPFACAARKSRRVSSRSLRGSASLDSPVAVTSCTSTP
jgi:hypothetical protein